MRRLALAAALVLVVAACGGDDSSPTTVGPGTTGANTQTTTAGSAATTTTEAPGEAFIPNVGLETMTQLTPTSGGGRRPMLAWEPVDGAVRYTVLVFDADGAPWWSWQGEATEVVIGGVATEDEIGGPAAGPGVTWVVFAYDADGASIAVSPQRSLDE